LRLVWRWSSAAPSCSAGACDAARYPAPSQPTWPRLRSPGADSRAAPLCTRRRRCSRARRCLACQRRPPPPAPIGRAVPCRPCSRPTTCHSCRRRQRGRRPSRHEKPSREASDRAPGAARTSTTRPPRARCPMPCGASARSWHRAVTRRAPRAPRPLRPSKPKGEPAPGRNRSRELGSPGEPSSARRSAPGKSGAAAANPKRKCWRAYTRQRRKTPAGGR
jgi:hypothetical protein